MPTIYEDIERILRIADAADKVDTQLDILHGISGELGIDLFDPAHAARVFDTNVGVVALKRFLDQLDYDRLLRITAVMYSGRDNDSVLGLMDYLPTTFSGKEDLVRKISEKRHNLSNYFSNGIAKSKAEGIDLISL